MAVVDDAELGCARARRVGRLGRAPLGTVERVEALAGELERETALGRLGLDQLGELRDLLQLAEVQHGRQAVGEPGLGEQRLGTFGVALTLRDRRIEERVHRGDHVVVADVGLALEQGVDQRLAVDAHAERLADPGIGELALVATHPDLAVGGGREADDGEVRGR